jgi:hypothetical protein
MKINYLKFVEWSKDDRLFVGYCPDLFVGGVCHGKNEQKVYSELCSLVEEELRERQSTKTPLPRREAIVAMTISV